MLDPQYHHGHGKPAADARATTVGAVAREARVSKHPSCRLAARKRGMLMPRTLTYELSLALAQEPSLEPEPEAAAAMTMEEPTVDRAQAALQEAQSALYGLQAQRTDLVRPFHQALDEADGERMVEVDRQLCELDRQICEADVRLDAARVQHRRGPSCATWRATCGHAHGGQAAAAAHGVAAHLSSGRAHAYPAFWVCAHTRAGAARSRSARASATVTRRRSGPSST
jgi:hypothetical protein